MKNKIILIILILIMLSLAFSFPERREIKRLPLTGDYVIQDDGSLWYVHSLDEVSGSCVGCHDDITEYWFCVEGDCVIIIENGEMRIECEGDDRL